MATINAISRAVIARSHGAPIVGSHDSIDPSAALHSGLELAIERNDLRAGIHEIATNAVYAAREQNGKARTTADPIFKVLYTKKQGTFFAESDSADGLSTGPSIERLMKGMHADLQAQKRFALEFAFDNPGAQAFVINPATLVSSNRIYLESFVKNSAGQIEMHSFEIPVTESLHSRWLSGAPLAKAQLENFVREVFGEQCFDSSSITGFRTVLRAQGAPLSVEDVTGKIASHLSRWGDVHDGEQYLRRAHSIITDPVAHEELLKKEIERLTNKLIDSLTNPHNPSTLTQELQKELVGYLSERGIAINSSSPIEFTQLEKLASDFCFKNLSAPNFDNQAITLAEAATSTTLPIIAHTNYFSLNSLTSATHHTSHYAFASHADTTSSGGVAFATNSNDVRVMPDVPVSHPREHAKNDSIANAFERMSVVEASLATRSNQQVNEQPVATILSNASIKFEAAPPLAHHIAFVIAANPRELNRGDRNTTSDSRSNRETLHKQFRLNFVNKSQETANKTNLFYSGHVATETTERNNRARIQNHTPAQQSVARSQRLHRISVSSPRARMLSYKRTSATTFRSTHRPPYSHRRAFGPPVRNRTISSGLPKSPTYRNEPQKQLRRPLVAERLIARLKQLSAFSVREVSAGILKRLRLRTESTRFHRTSKIYKSGLTPRTGTHSRNLRTQGRHQLRSVIATLPSPSRIRLIALNNPRIPKLITKLRAELSTRDKRILPKGTLSSAQYLLLRSRISSVERRVRMILLRAHRIDAHSRHPLSPKEYRRIANLLLLLTRSRLSLRSLSPAGLRALQDLLDEFIVRPQRQARSKTLVNKSLDSFRNGLTAQKQDLDLQEFADSPIQKMQGEQEGFSGRELPQLHVAATVAAINPTIHESLEIKPASSSGVGLLPENEAPAYELDIVRVKAEDAPTHDAHESFALS